jgi:hypothetical protein
VSLNGTEQQADEIVKVIKPQGNFIDDPKSFDVMAFKHKAVSTYQFMFTLCFKQKTYKSNMKF